MKRKAVSRAKSKRWLQKDSRIAVARTKGDNSQQLELKVARTNCIENGSRNAVEWQQKAVSSAK